MSDLRAKERDQQALLDHAEELLRQQAIILRDMEHCVANSLQIIRQYPDAESESGFIG